MLPLSTVLSQYSVEFATGCATGRNTSSIPAAFLQASNAASLAELSCQTSLRRDGSPMISSARDTRLCSKPLLKALACTAVLAGSTNGILYRLELCVGQLPSKV